MINLLPKESKKQIRAAHTNVKLVSLIVFSLVAMTFLGLSVYMSHIFIENSSVDDSSSSTYQTTKLEYDTIISKIDSSKAILAKKSNFSQAIQIIGTSMPVGASAETMSLQSELDTINLTAVATDEALLTQLQNNLQSSGFFSIVTKSESSSASGSGKYEVQADFLLYVNRNYNG
jgi:hypothetical protein